VSIRYPFLKAGERIRYDVVSDDGSGQIKADNVTWLNGTPIPPLRKNYLGTVHERVRRSLGDHCYEIMSSSAALSDVNLDEIWVERIRDAYEHARSAIREAEDLIERLGMKVEDFPTHVVETKTSRGTRHRYTTAAVDDEEEADTDGDGSSS